VTCAFADVSGADVCRRREAGGVATRRSAPAAPVGRSTWAVRTAGAEQGPANASRRAPAPAPAEDSMSMSVISLPRSAMALQRMATNPVTQGDAHDGDAGPVVGVAGRTVSSLACAHALVCVQMDACVRCSERVFVYGVRGACAPSSHTHTFSRPLAHVHARGHASYAHAYVHALCSVLCTSGAAFVPPLPCRPAPRDGRVANVPSEDKSWLIHAHRRVRAPDIARRCDAGKEVRPARMARVHTSSPPHPPLVPPPLRV